MGVYGTGRTSAMQPLALKAIKFMHKNSKKPTHPISPPYFFKGRYLGKVRKFGDIWQWLSGLNNINVWGGGIKPPRPDRVKS